MIRLQRDVGAELRAQLAEGQDADETPSAAEQKAEPAGGVAWDLEKLMTIGVGQEREKEYRGRCHRGQRPAFFPSVGGASAQRVKIDAQNKHRGCPRADCGDQSGSRRVREELRQIT